MESDGREDDVAAKLGPFVPVRFDPPDGISRARCGLRIPQALQYQFKRVGLDEQLGFAIGAFRQPQNGRASVEKLNRAGARLLGVVT